LKNNVELTKTNKYYDELSRFNYILSKVPLEYQEEAYLVNDIMNYVTHNKDKLFYSNLNLMDNDRGLFYLTNYLKQNNTIKLFNLNNTIISDLNSVFINSWKFSLSISIFSK